MQCPACRNTLTENTVGDVKVDICNGGCGGAWFDHLEIKKFDEPHEFAGELVLRAERDPKLKIDRGGTRDCPKCDKSNGSFLIRRWYDQQHEVEVDQCSRCSGIWLDIGELETIRSQFETEEQRQAAFDSFIQSFLDQAVQSVEETTEQLRQENQELRDAGFFKRLTLLFSELLGMK